MHLENRGKPHITAFCTGIDGIPGALCIIFSGCIGQIECNTSMPRIEEWSKEIDKVQCKPTKQVHPREIYSPLAFNLVSSKIGSVPARNLLIRLLVNQSRVLYKKRNTLWTFIPSSPPPPSLFFSIFHHISRLFICSLTPP